MKQIQALMRSGACGLLLSASLLMPCATYAGQQSAPDNTKVNKSDAPTADQATNKSADRELARKIRRDVVKDKSLSTYGHNVKIIAAGGKVTLKGPVHTEDERKAIVDLAKKQAGDDNVMDQLTVKGDSK